MAFQRTLGIIKPDAVKNQYLGKIVDHAIASGLKVAGLRMLQMSPREARIFYEVHKDKKFYGELTQYMSEGPCVTMVLEGEDAITNWRDQMGATNPAEAEAGTIRKLYAESFTRNAVHGSDGPETAAVEIRFFFPDRDVF